MAYQNFEEEFDEAGRAKRQRRNELTDSGFIALAASLGMDDAYFQHPPEEADRPLSFSTNVPYTGGVPLFNSIDLQHDLRNMGYNPVDQAEPQLTAPPLSLNDSFSAPFSLYLSDSGDLGKPRVASQGAASSSSSSAPSASSSHHQHPALGRLQPQGPRAFLLRSDSVESNDKLAEEVWSEEYIMRKSQEFSILKGNYDSADKLLTRIKHRLKNCSLPLSPDHITYFSQNLQQSRELLAVCAVEGQKLLDTAFLPPLDIHKTLYLIRDCENLMAQHQLYLTEFECLRVPSRPMPPLAKLVIAKHPFPKA